MAFTRKYLKSIGLTDEQIESVMEEHVAVTDGLKEQISTYKADAEQLTVVQKDLEDLKANTADYDTWKQKYTDEHTAFEDYKKNVVKTEQANRVKEAYKALLKAQKIDDKRIDSIIKLTNLDGKKLNTDGKFDDEESMVKSIKDEWSDFIVTVKEKAADEPSQPLNNSGGKKLTKEEIMKISNASERQQAIAENPDLFGIAE